MKDNMIYKMKRPLISCSYPKIALRNISKTVQTNKMKNINLSLAQALATAVQKVCHLVTELRVRLFIDFKDFTLKFKDFTAKQGL